MSSKHDDRYSRGSEDDSQVRSIIRQLNEEKPSKEKSREVVVRPDGTKVIRVVKKRKVLMTNEEKNRRSRRSFMMGLLVVLVLLGAFGAFFAIRMSSMSGESYLNEKGQELQEAWGARSVRCFGANIDGMEMEIAGIVAEFPEGSMIERVELSKVKADLDTSSFFTGVLTGDSLSIARATVQLRSDVRKLEIPLQKGDDLWKFKRISCDDFRVSVGAAGDAASPLSLQSTSAYIYHPSGNKAARVAILRGGMLRLRGWKAIEIREAKLQVTPVALEDIHLRGTTDSSRSKDGDEPQSEISISGTLAEGADLQGPFMMDSDNMNFSDFTAGRFVQFFTASTVAGSRGHNKPTAQVFLPFDRERPEFRGSFRLKDIRITSLPALLLLTEHIEPDKRRQYRPPYIYSGVAQIEPSDGGLSLKVSEGDMKERDLLSLRIDLTVNAANEISGSIDYGIPAILTHVEYPDGLADPIFKDDGENAWLSTKVSGMANHPTDDSADLDQRAEEERKSRPARTPFDQLNVDMLNARLNPDAAGTSPSGADTRAANPLSDGTEGTQGASGTAPAPAPSAQPLPGTSREAEQTPSSEGGLTLPVDDSIFGPF